MRHDHVGAPAVAGKGQAGAQDGLTMENGVFVELQVVMGRCACQAGGLVDDTANTGQVGVGSLGNEDDLVRWILCQFRGEMLELSRHVLVNE
jgi:hypothetical protein